MRYELKCSVIIKLVGGTDSVETDSSTHMVTAPCDDVWAHRLELNKTPSVLIDVPKTHLQNDSVNCPQHNHPVSLIRHDREGLFIFSIRMTEESDQVCHACHDPHDMSIFIYRFVLSFPPETFLDRKRSIIVWGLGCWEQFVTEAKRE